MILIGLTGGIATGKSTVSRLLREEFDVYVIDADQIVRDLQRPWSRCVRDIQRAWPACVNATTGELDRTALGDIVFRDPAARKRLAGIMNGPIFMAIIRRILSVWWRDLVGHSVSASAMSRSTGSQKPRSRPQVVVLDAPLLFETNIYTYVVSASVVVSCREETQLCRLIEMRGFTQKQARARCSSQMPLVEKRRRAGYVVENDADLEVLRENVGCAVEWMRMRNAHYLMLLIAGTVMGVTSAVIAPLGYLSFRLVRQWTCGG